MNNLRILQTFAYLYRQNMYPFKVKIFKVNKNNFFTGSQTCNKPNTSRKCLEKETDCVRPQND